MSVSQRNQKGSAISALLIFAVLAYGVFIAIQYAPLYVESSTVDSVLSSILGSHKAQPITGVQEAQRKIDVLLNVNEIRDMKEYFQVRDYRGEILIDVTYNRDINLLFQTKTIRYEKSLILPRPP